MKIMNYELTEENIQNNNNLFIDLILKREDNYNLSMTTNVNDN